MPSGAGITAFELALVLGLGTAAAACAGSQAAPVARGPGSAPAVTPAPGGLPAPGGPAAPPQPAWSAMTAELRRNYMKAVVMPKMKDFFVAFNSARYEKMTCTTCHGDGETNASFKMPNDKLPRLPDSPEGFKRLAADKAAICQLMLTKIKPTMAALLGMPELTAESRTGFGCGNCHPR